MRLLVCILLAVSACAQSAATLPLGDAAQPDGTDGGAGPSDGGGDGGSRLDQGGADPRVACPPLPAPAGRVTSVDPSQAAALEQMVAGAEPGDTLMLKAGTYNLGGANLRFDRPGVTLRSESGDRESVVIDGNYASGEPIAITASNVTIADVTIARAYNHAIHAQPGGATVTGINIYNVHVVDPGQQGIKINSNGSFVTFVDDGIIACSHIEMTDAGRSQVRDDCYTGGIDGHQASGWRVYNNLIEGFWCPVGLSEHGIHFWTGSRGTLVERNLLKNNARAIGFGLGSGPFGFGRTYGDQPCPGVDAAGHYLGVIRNNFIAVSDDRVFDSGAGFDTGIGLEQACGATLAHNSVASTRPAVSSAIEWRFTFSNPILLNNLVTQNLVARDGAAAAMASGNYEHAPLDTFVDVAGGDLHLRATATEVIRGGAALAPGVCDDDIDLRPRRLDAPSIGAHER